MRRRDYAFSAAVVAACTLVSILLQPVLNPVNFAMFYLLGTVAVAMRSSRRVAFVTSFASVAALTSFCVPPYLTVAVSDYEYAVTFAVMLIVAITISSLTTGIRAQAAHAVGREACTQALYRLSRELTGELRDFDAARIATEVTQEVFGCEVVVFLLDERGRVSFSKRTSDDLPVPRAEEGVAQWAVDHKQRAGKGTDTLPGSSALYLPLRGARDVIGAMAVLPDETQPMSPEQMHLLELFAAQIALAIERSHTFAAITREKLRAETEQMRSSLLSAVWPDLRTPLASITGAATTLLEQNRQLFAATQRDLLESIA